MNNKTQEWSRCDGLCRRSVLQLGQLAGLGLAPQLLPAIHATETAPKKATSCILVWLDGGPSHLETFDIKPDAPTEVRGPLSSIATSVPGVAITECMPQLAKRMKDVAVIRSMTSPLGEHNLGTHYMLTGYQPTPILEYPSFHAVANQRLGGQQDILPNNIAIPEYRVGGASYNGVGFLPPELGAFSLRSDPAKGNFGVRNMELGPNLNLERISRRRQFATQLQRWRSGDDGVSVQPEFERAFQLVTSPTAAEAFRLDDEAPATRKRYGSKSVGQSCLLARRLVERGVRFITVNQRGWDTHENLYTRLKEGYTGAKVGVGLIPSLDLAVSSLMDDLQERGLFDETLIVVMGEFGRTPKLNTRGGRDHWPRVFSVALAGGGVQGGQIVGESDEVGESPKDRPVTPADLVATIYSLLGIDPSLELITPDGRPVRLTSANASVVPELLG